MARATKSITVSVSQHKPDFEVCPVGTLRELAKVKCKLNAILTILHGRDVEDVDEAKPIFGGVYVYPTGVVKGPGG